MKLDRDLQSIQEVRELMIAARQAQRDLAGWDQRQIDRLVEQIVLACEQNAGRLAELAVEETGFGIAEDKVLKNLLGSRTVWDYIKDMKTVGIVSEDKARGLIEVAVPVGVVAALIPSTNPTSTAMFKTIISLKAGNAIVLSPHPNAQGCIKETVAVMRQAAKAAGAPDGLIGCIETCTMQATNELMRHKFTGVILATGGGAMVKAAYSSGNPAIGVGPGNGPAYIERSADVKKAVKRILDSKTFDNGTICASEQSVVTEGCIKERVVAELKDQGAWFMDAEQSQRVERLIMRPNNTMNPAIVGKSATTIAKMAGITVPLGTRVLISEQSTVSPRNPYSREKLCPILAFYTEENWERACERCIEILENEGVGHTMTIHSENEEVIREFALKKPISRLLVNTPGALGGVGATTNLAPALTLGCGAVGGSATSDNVGPMNLLNIRRVAWGVRELEDLRSAAPAAAQRSAPPQMSEADIARITKEVIKNLQAQGYQL